MGSSSSSSECDEPTDPSRFFISFLVFVELDDSLSLPLLLLVWCRSRSRSRSRSLSSLSLVVVLLLLVWRSRSRSRSLSRSLYRSLSRSFSRSRSRCEDVCEPDGWRILLISFRMSSTDICCLLVAGIMIELVAWLTYNEYYNLKCILWTLVDYL